MVDLETCYEWVRDVVVVLDPDGTVRWASPSVERVLGHGREALVGEDLFAYVHLDDEERVFETDYTTGDGRTGFGTSIVERIAEAHGWSVSVGEGADGGAHISVTDVEVLEG